MNKKVRDHDQQEDESTKNPDQPQQEDKAPANKGATKVEETHNRPHS